MLSHFAHAHCSVARGLNTRAHISPRSPRVFILDSGTTDPAISTYILRAARLNSTVEHFFPHTRPPDMLVGLEYQRPLVNTYCMFDLRSHLRARHRLGPRQAFTVTRSGAGIDLPGFGHGRSDMSDHEDDAPAARGALGSRARRTADRDDDRHRPWRKSDFPSDDAAFERCRVKSPAWHCMSTTLSRPSRTSTA